MKRTVLLPLAALMAIAVHPQAGNYPNGSTVPNFTLTDLNGTTHSLHQYTSQGKYVMLDFFFVACPPCQETTQYFGQLYQTYGCNSANLICISVNRGIDNNASIHNYFNTYGGGWAHPPSSNAATGGPLANQFGIQAYPTYCLIGPNNVMINNDIWPISNMQTFVSAFPPGSNIQPASCSQSGIGEETAALGTTAWPVPGDGWVTVSLPDEVSGRIDAEVFDAMGRQVHAQRVEQARGSFVLDLQRLADAHYVLVLSDTQGRRSTHRLVIAR